jgi:RNA polymerase sigma factor (sigma-70 family)
MRESITTTDSFEKMLGDSSEECFRHALRLTKESEAAKDLVQETMTRAFIYKDRFQEGTNFKAWIYTIMRNLFLNQYNKQKKNPSTLDINNPEVSYNIYDRSVSNAGYRYLVEDDINNAIHHLEEKYKATFSMHFRGFQYKEIAEKMKLPIGTVKNRIHVARKLLQSNLRSQFN